jgi:hypothetical protein
MFTILGGNRWHSWSSCKEVTNADFGHGDLPRASGNQLPHFMNWTPGTGGWVNWGWCPKDDASILYASNSYQEIVDFITNIKLHDGTATHIGMKYGVALLNPSSRDEFGLLADADVIEEQYRNRPADFDDEEVVKYIVLMTDGATTGQHRPAVMNTAAEYQKVYNSSHSEYATVMNRYGSTRADGTANTAAHVETGLVGNNNSDDRLFHDGSTRHDEGTNNGNIDRMCNWAKEPVLDDDGNVLKNDRITVFTISFFTTGPALTRMENCASRPTFHFPVQNLNIESAFQAIAKTINQLRLTL